MMCNAPQETNSKVIINTRRSLIRTFLDIELLALVLFQRIPPIFNIQEQVVERFMPFRRELFCTC